MFNFRSLDFFRKLPNEIETSTASGGLFTLIAFLVYFYLCQIGGFLFYQEYNLFVSKEIQRQMIIDNNYNSNMMRINIDITFHKFPCAILSLCQEDELGHHTVDIGETIHKIRLDKYGYVINQKQNNDPEYVGSDQEVKDLQNSIDQGEQCLLQGHIFVPKVPGDFHISYHKRRELAMLAGMEYFEREVLDYTINHLSFREAEKNFNHKIFQKFQDLGIHEFQAMNFSPYDRLSVLESSKDKKTYNNYIKIIPNKFIDEENNSFSTYQFSMNMRNATVEFNEFVNLYFNYEVSPIVIQYQIINHSFFHFIVELLAIIGGIFSMIGIINTLTQETISKFDKKSY